ncbi:hypothetical protein, partial [Plasmodium yoelii yoelii]
YISYLFIPQNIKFKN